MEMNEGEGGGEMWTLGWTERERLKASGEERQIFSLLKRAEMKKTSAESEEGREDESPPPLSSWFHLKHLYRCVCVWGGIGAKRKQQQQNNLARFVKS